MSYSIDGLRLLIRTCAHCEANDVPGDQCKFNPKVICAACKETDITCTPGRVAQYWIALHTKVLRTIWPYVLSKRISAELQKKDCPDYVLLQGLALAALFLAKRSTGESLDMAREWQNLAHRSIMKATKCMTEIASIDKSMQPYLFLWWTFYAVTKIEMLHYIQPDMAFMSAISVTMKRIHQHFLPIKTCIGDDLDLELCIQKRQYDPTLEDVAKFPVRTDILTLIDSLGQDQLGNAFMPVRTDFKRMTNEVARLYCKLRFEKDILKESNKMDGRFLLHWLTRVEPIHAETWKLVDNTGDIWLVVLAQWAVLLWMRTGGDNADGDGDVWWMHGLAKKIKTHVHKVFQEKGLMREKIWADTLRFMDEIK